MGVERPVMIVDDEAHIRTYLRLVCEKRLSRPVLEAVDGSSALRLAEEFRPDLIVLDISMPRMNGIAALRELRRLLPGTPVAMLSVLANRATVRECAQAGAAAYLRKDAPIEQIFSVLERLVSGPATANVFEEITGV